MTKPPKEASDQIDAEKRQVYLVWNGKSRDVCTIVLPFQSLEHVEMPRQETPEMQSDLFDTRGRQLKGCTNKLIYIDPPFDIGADFSVKPPMTRTGSWKPKAASNSTCRQRWPACASVPRTRRARVTLKVDQPTAMSMSTRLNLKGILRSRSPHLLRSSLHFRTEQ